MNNSSKSVKAEKPFSPLLFVSVNLTTFAVLIGLFYVVSPAEVFRTQFTASWSAYVVSFVCWVMFNSFVEFFFHRYFLHSSIFPGFGRLYREHTKHHGLTHVVMRHYKGEDLPVIENKYPITEPEQHEASFFPWYSQAAFALAMLPVYILIQWLFPGAPIILAGLFSILWNLSCYELVHATEHWPLEKWYPLLKHPTQGSFWRKIYGFHLRHHVDMKCNESISGFFGIPIPDFVFGTHVSSERLYEQGTYETPEAFLSPKPCAFIKWLDGLAEKRMQKLRHRKVRVYMK
jgi:hemolysin III